MKKKHYEAIAKIFARYINCETTSRNPLCYQMLLELSMDLSDYFEKTNRGYSRDKFLKGCIKQK